MTRTREQTEPDLQTLKSLLLSDERCERMHLSAAVQRLADRIGTDEALQASVRRVFAQTLDQVSKEDPAVISRALAPIVMNSMGQQIKNSADEVVEIMYPLTGRMIAASVKGAIATLSDRINSEIEARFPLRTTLLTLRSQLFGVSASDLVLAAAERCTIERIMILTKASGKLVQAWHANGGEVDSNQNDQLVTGMLAALNSLAEEAFEASAGSLRTVQLDGRQIALRSSASHLLIAEVTGVLKPADEQKIDHFFGSWVEGKTTGKEPDTDRALEALAKDIGDESAAVRVTSDPAPSPKHKLIKTLGVALLIGSLLSWPAWQTLQRWSLDADVKRITQLIASNQHLAGFPLRVEPIPETGSIAVTGLLPAGTDLRALRLAWLAATEHRPLETNVRYVLATPLLAPQW